MDTNYTLDAFTLRFSEDNGDSPDTGLSKIVLVVDAIKTDQKHVSYQTYLDTNLSLDEADGEADFTADAGRHFTMYERLDAKTVLSKSATGSSRYFGEMYAKSLPVLSDDQQMICMPRFLSTSQASPRMVRQDEKNDEPLKEKPKRRRRVIRRKGNRANANTIPESIT